MIFFMPQSKRRMTDKATLKLWPLLVLTILTGVAMYLWTVPVLQERRWQAASLEQLEVASRRDPTNARVFYYLGLHLQGLGQTDAAQTAYMRAVTLDPDGLAATIRDLHQRKTQAAIPADRLIQDANALLARNQVTEAERGFTAILTQDPASAPAHYGLGLIWETQGKTDEAFRAYNQAVHLQSDLFEAQYHLALLYYRSGFPDEAERRMKVLVKQAPNVSRYWYGLGNCVKEDEARNLDAQADFRHAALLDPRSIECALAVADTEANAHQDAAAERDYRQAFALRPGDAASSIALGMFLLDHKFSTEGQAEAERLLRIVLTSSPHDPAALKGLGRIALSRNDARQAVALLEDAEVHSPSDPKIWYLLGHAYDGLGNAKRAAYCRMAFQGLSDYLRQLGFVQELAQQHLNDPLLRLKLARLYAQGGQYAQAINQYEMCRHLSPSNLSAPKELAALTKQLKASGQMPSMSAFNGMMIASIKNQTQPAPTALP